MRRSDHWLGPRLLFIVFPSKMLVCVVPACPGGPFWRVKRRVFLLNGPFARSCSYPGGPFWRVKHRVFCYRCLSEEVAGCFPHAGAVQHAAVRVCMRMPRCSTPQSAEHAVSVCSCHARACLHARALHGCGFSFWLRTCPLCRLQGNMASPRKIPKTWRPKAPPEEPPAAAAASAAADVRCSFRPHLSSYRVIRLIDHYLVCNRRPDYVEL